ncbi:hypothetical protein BGW42_007824 [Actinomortierella wolfii]|nr:hypothetical protein BGW42_007824 [Actinomortierella wolfii]
MGPRSRLGRISKRELSKVDIVQTCRDISQPPEALALRLSSNLMYGVTRVYGQQVNIVYVDANHVWTQIRRDTTILELGRLDMHQSSAKFEAITFEDAPNIEEQVHQSAKSALFSHDLELEQARKVAHDLAVEFGWATGTLSQSMVSQASSSTPQIGTRGNLAASPRLIELGDGVENPFLSISNEQRRRITLDEGSMLDTDLRDLRAGTLHHDPSLGLPFGDEVLMGGAGDDGLYFDDEGNLLALDGSESTAQKMSSVAEGKKRKRDDYDGDMVDTAARRVVDVEQPESEHAMYNVFGVDLEDPLTSIAGVAGASTMMDGDDGIVPTIQQSSSGTTSRRLNVGGPKSWRLMIDDPTMLTREEIQQSRARLTHDLAAAVRAQVQKQAEQRVREQLNALLCRPVSLQEYSVELAEFWAMVAARPSLAPVTSTLNAQHMSTLASGGFAARPYLDYHHRGGDSGADVAGMTMGYHTDDEPELVRRRANDTDTASSRQLSPLRDAMPWDEHLRATGQSEKASSSTSGSHGSHDHASAGLVPWSDFDQAFEEAPGDSSGRGGGRRGSSTSGDPHRRYRRWPSSGVSTPTGRQSRASSPHAVDDMSWALLFGDHDGTSLSHGATPPPFTHPLGSLSEGSSEGSNTSSRRDRTAAMGMMAMASSSQESVPSSGGGVVVAESTLVNAHGLEVTVERETASFLRYIKSILRDAKASDFYFADVVTPLQKRAVAAAAFYHILGK